MNRFTRRANSLMPWLGCGWLATVPVLAVTGIWWNQLWVVLLAETAVLWVMATAIAYDSRYQGESPD